MPVSLTISIHALLSGSSRYQIIIRMHSPVHISSPAGQPPASLHVSEAGYKTGLTSSIPQIATGLIPTSKAGKLKQSFRKAFIYKANIL